MTISSLTHQFADSPPTRQYRMPPGEMRTSLKKLGTDQHALHAPTIATLDISFAFSCPGLFYPSNSWSVPEPTASPSYGGRIPHLNLQPPKLWWAKLPQVQTEPRSKKRRWGWDSVPCQLRGQAARDAGRLRLRRHEANEGPVASPCQLLGYGFPKPQPRENGWACFFCYLPSPF